MYQKNLNIRYIILLVLESVLIFVTVQAVEYLRVIFFGEAFLGFDQYYQKIILVTAVCLVSFHYFELYHPSTLHLNRQMINNLYLSLISASIILLVIYYILPSFKMGQGSLIANLLVLPFVLIAWRAAYLKWLSGDLPIERVLVLGSGNFAKKITSEIISTNELGLKVMGFIDDDPVKFGVSIVNPKVLGGYIDLMKAVKALKIDRIIIALPDRRKKMPMAALLNCKLMGVKVEEGETFHERITGKVPLDQLRPSWLVFSEGFKSLRSRKYYKRITGIIFSIFGLIIAIPFFVIIPIIIRLDSSGPVIIKQKRVGEKGEVYILYKFRSMKNNAESGGNPTWTQAKDERITRVGRIIRKLRIDELPQMWS